jgi:enoyl-[acyl-carrier-protein] reductase (NADH)
MAIAGITNKSIEDYFADAARQFVPQNRMLDPSEPGALATFLCREEARGITGEALRISAGSHW